MDVSKMKHAWELPFEVPEPLAESIEAFRRACEEDDPSAADCMEDVAACARMAATDEQDDWIREYYVMGGWDDDGDSRPV